jgi:hypothetical protein
VIQDGYSIGRSRNRARLAFFGSSPVDMSKARQPPPASTSRTALLAPPSAPPSVDLLTLVGREYANLRNQSHCPLGMYIVPSVASLLLWDGVFFVHKGSR